MRRRFPASLVLAVLAAGLATPVFGGPAWRFDYDKTLEEAKAQQREVLLDFTASWCGPCRMMENTTFADPAAQSALAGYALVKIDIDQQPLVAARYQVQAIPACILLNKFGEVVDKHVGYVDSPGFVDWLDRADGQRLARTKVSQADALAGRMRLLEAALDRPDLPGRNQALATLLKIYCAHKTPDESSTRDVADPAGEDKAVEDVVSLSPEGGKLMEGILSRFVQRQGSEAAGYLKDPRLAVRILFARLFAEKAGSAFQFDPWAAAPARTGAADAWASRFQSP